MGSSTTLAPVRDLFRAVTRAVAPLSAGFDEGEWKRAEDIVNGALARRPASVRRQLPLFLRVVDLLARLRFGRGLPSLDATRVRRILFWLERAPALLLRRGVWGVRTLAFMGVYGQPTRREALGYEASLRGWQDRGAGLQGPWPERDGAGPPEATILTVEDTPGREASDA
jgi:hypothetical protein